MHERKEKVSEQKNNKTTQQEDGAWTAVCSVGGLKESGPDEGVDVGLVVQCASHRFLQNLERHGEIGSSQHTCDFPQSDLTL